LSWTCKGWPFVSSQDFLDHEFPDSNDSTFYQTSWGELHPAGRHFEDRCLCELAGALEEREDSSCLPESGNEVNAREQHRQPVQMYITRKLHHSTFGFEDIFLKQVPGSLPC